MNVTNLRRRGLINTNMKMINPIRIKIVQRKLRGVVELKSV
jgi:hypothetical protein